MGVTTLITRKVIGSSHYIEMSIMAFCLINRLRLIRPYYCAIAFLVATDTTKDQDPHKLIRERAEAHVRRLEELVVAIGGEDATVESVLPTKYLEGPESVRRDAPLPEWTPDQIEAAQAVAHELGWGSEQDVESGLSGGVRILEGGLAWKIAAELEAAQRDGDPNSLILVGSKNRKITDDERGINMILTKAP
jgi:hypothetical protein